MRSLVVAIVTTMLVAGCKSISQNTFQKPSITIHEAAEKGNIESIKNHYVLRFYSVEVETVFQTSLRCTRSCAGIDFQPFALGFILSRGVAPCWLIPTFGPQTNRSNTCVAPGVLPGSTRTILVSVSQVHARQSSALDSTSC